MATTAILRSSNLVFAKYVKQSLVEKDRASDWIVALKCQPVKLRPIKTPTVIVSTINLVPVGRRRKRGTKAKMVRTKCVVAEEQALGIRFLKHFVGAASSRVGRLFGRVGDAMGGKVKNFFESVTKVVTREIENMARRLGVDLQKGFVQSAIVAAILACLIMIGRYSWEASLTVIILLLVYLNKEPIIDFARPFLSSALHILMSSSEGLCNMAKVLFHLNPSVKESLAAGEGIARAAAALDIDVEESTVIAEEQSGFFPIIKKSFMALMMLSLIRAPLTPGCFTAAVGWMRRFPRIVSEISGAKKGAQCTTDGLEDLIYETLSACGKAHLIPFSKKGRTLAIEVERFVSEQKLVATKPTVEVCKTVTKYIHALNAAKSACKGDAITVNALTNAMRTLTTYSDGEGITAMRMALPRPVPTFLVLMGAPGLGKTTCVQQLCRHLYNCARPEIQERTELNGGSHTFKRNYQTNFWEGFWGQYVTTYDDMGQHKERMTDKVNLAAEIVNVCNSDPFMLDMAFGGKGKTYFDSEFIIATTNMTNLYPLAAEHVRDVKAFARRFHLVYTLELNPKYAHFYVGNKVSNGLVRAEMAKDPNFRPYDIWQFKQVIGYCTDDVSQQEFGKPITFPQLLRLMLANHQEHATEFAFNQESAFEADTSEIILDGIDDYARDSPLLNDTSTDTRNDPSELICDEQSGVRAPAKLEIDEELEYPSWFQWASARIPLILGTLAVVTGTVYLASKFFGEDMIIADEQGQNTSQEFVSLHKNLVSIDMCDYEGNKTAHVGTGTVVRRNTILLNTHFLRGMANSGSSHVMVTRFSDRAQSFCPVSNFLSLRQATITGRDLTLLEYPALPAFSPDILAKFRSKAKHDFADTKKMLPDAVLVGCVAEGIRATDMSIVKYHVVATAQPTGRVNNRQGELLHEGYLSYGAFTLPGDCGSVLLDSTKQGGVICGMHTAACSNSAFATIVYREDLSLIHI